jgi:hypothetical protein
VATATLVPVSAVEVLKELKVPSGTGDVLAEAKQHLSYEPEPRVVQAELQHPIDEKDLLAILREHEVLVYRPTAVAAYKQHKIKASLRLLRLWRNSSVVTAAMALVATAITWIYTGLGLLMVAPGILCVAALISYRVAVDHLSRARAEWNRLEISQYKEAIPIDALQMATTLKKANSKLRVFVDKFQVRQIPHDPMMSVALGEAEFCIQVWDEPGFNAELV